MYKDLNQYQIGDYTKDCFKLIAELITRKEVEEGATEELHQQGIFTSDSLEDVDKLYDSEKEIQEMLENEDSSLLELYDYNKLYFNMKNRELDDIKFIGVKDYKIEKTDKGLKVIVDTKGQVDKLGRPVIDIYDYKFTENSSTVEHTWTSRVGDNQFKRLTKIKYNDDTKHSIKTFYDKNENIGYSLCYHCNKDRKTEYKRIPNGESFKFKYESTTQCDENGRPLYYIKENINRMVIEVGKYVYLDDGRILKIVKLQNVNK